MTTSTPAPRRDEDLPGAGERGGRRQRRSGGGRRSGGQRRARIRGPLRTLLSLLVVTVLLFGGIGAARLWADPPASLTPQLGLDLAGGRQIVMEPITEDGSTVSAEQLEQAIDIIRRRVDGGGVTEAEVTRQGQNVSVAIPGNPTPDQVEALSRSSQLRFRPVLIAQPTGPEAELPEQRRLPLPPSLIQEQLEEFEQQQQDAQESGTPPEEDSVDEAPPGDEAEQTDENRGGTRLPASGSDDAAATEAPGVPAEDGADSTAPPGEDGATTPSDPSSLAQITPELQQEFTDLDCAAEGVATQVASAPTDQPTVACSVDGDEKFILGPVELTGSSVTDANAGPETVQGGAVTGRWQVNLTFDGEGGQTFAEITSRLYGYPQGEAQNRFATVLDGQVITAPTVNSVISGGTATISGDFTPEESQTLANQLKFGALPLSFEVQTSEQISPTLGGEQLRYGVIAGIIGLLLVFAYMLVQYHALGLVAIGSLVVAALLAYGSVTLLGWANNFRLTMAGVTGLIVAIGITADSFIVYFERIRDEVRAGRPLRYAVDTGWDRARRTLIISDLVNLIAATVLYLLSESGVKAFAFALGLTTIIDLVVVFMFTHPLVSILANTRFFGEGRKWSGMEPERLGAKRSAYLGRGRVREPDVIAPGRRRHTREELEGGVV
ncbi:Protein-export membrane protein SecD [Serinicoccus hydrothermalis]|uniref:Protein translocase subunit SecD n=1 Tax=Serinicoccus hydrothermalis TaxID=1758689 RepID=A0A1B1N8T8_9MICO|nr:protein translocase subunit SecD [Serinicoccus hydrothermalis]ANS77839.1 Protein-export membrane protein SecD [Serinicoccus hydrothermalis]